MNLDALIKNKTFNWSDLLDTPSSITANEFVIGNGAGTELAFFDLFDAANIWTAENTFNENLFGLSSIYIGGVTQVDLCGTYNFVADAVAQWKCNDNLATTTVIDSVGSFTGIATTNTNNLSTTGKINEAFNFVSGNSEFIDLGSTSIIGSGNYTILGRFKASSPDDFQRLYTEGNSGNDLLYTSVGFRQDGHIRFTVVRFGTSMGIETSTDYGDGAWHSFMARRSASNDWDLYIDGGVETINSTTDVSSPTIDQVTLGALRRIASDNYWNGDIDNVLIINRAIADSEYLSWHDGESEDINTGEGSVINGIGITSVICSQKLADSEKNLLVEGDIEVSNIFFNTVSSKEINGSISILLDNVAGADLIIGNNNALVVEGDNDRVGIGILAPLVPLHLPDNTAIGFGNTANVTIDYDSVLSVGMFDGGNWLMNSTNQLQFGDTGTYIAQLNDGHLDLFADISVDINALSFNLSTSNMELRFYEDVNYVGFKAPALTSNTIWTLPAVDGNANDILVTDGNKVTDWKTVTIRTQISFSMYDAEPSRGNKTSLDGAFIPLVTGQPLDSIPTDLIISKGTGKIVIIINAGSDLTGEITVTGTSVDRNTGVTTGSDTDIITIDALTTDNSDTDTNGNTRYSLTGAYITSKWFVGTVTLSTTNLTLTDVDVYHVSFEQFDDTEKLILDTFDANILTTNVNAEFDAYLYSLEVTGNKCDILREASLNVGADGETAIANRYWRLRRANIAKVLDGTTDGTWVDVHYSNSPAYVEDVTIKVWATETHSLTLN